MSTTLEEITAIANDERLKPGPKAGLVWAKVNYNRPPTGMQLVKGMGVCRNTAEGWLRVWERYGYLFRLPCQASDGTWTWRRFFPEHSTDAQKVSIKASTSTSRSRDTSSTSSSSTTDLPRKNEVIEIAANAQKVSIGATRQDEPELDLEELKQRSAQLLAALSTGR